MADVAELAPLDIGLPPKFAEYRQGQLDPALDIVASDRRWQYLSAPVGTGKSLTYMTVAKLMEARTLVLVGTKGLQTQLMDDFAAVGMHDVRGANNYPCIALTPGGVLHGLGPERGSCDDGPCKAGVSCRLRPRKQRDGSTWGGGCLYYDAREDASHSQIVVSNYAFWLSLARGSDPLAIGKFDLLILDEAHTAPDWLADFCAIELQRKEVAELLEMNLPPLDEGVDVWVEWARKAAVIANSRYADAQESLKDTFNTNRRNLVVRVMRLGKLSRSLDHLSRARGWHNAESTARDTKLPGMETDWVTQDLPDKQLYNPVWAHAYAEEFLFRSIPKVLLSSATLSPEVGKYLGIPPKQSEWHEVRSAFNRKRRPFYICPIVRVDHRMTEQQIALWVEHIDQIIDTRVHLKGIIHTVSYKRAQELMSRSRHKHLMLTHDSRTSRATIEKFKSSSKPCILVSPSVVEGFDFPYDECRWQIIAKIPFSDGRDPVFKARRTSDNNYGNYLASLAIMQMTGRSTRAKDDASEVFVVDDHWGWFQSRIRWPKWFKESWEWVRQIPPPLDLNQWAK